MISVSVADSHPDPDPYVFGPPDPHLDPLVTGTDPASALDPASAPDPASALDSAPNPSIIKLTILVLGY
jgi:hypothetical protein